MPASSTSIPTSASAASPPHILMIVMDQLRLDAINPTVSPNLHRLSQTSTTFANAYVSTPTCTPSRAALLTGRSPWNHGMLGYAGAVNCLLYDTTLPSVLDEVGYQTFVVGKNHFGVAKKDDDALPSFIDHGYQTMKLYEGLSDIKPDDYDEWFNSTHPNVNPLETCTLSWNAWEACPYAFDEYDHPTSWTTREALDLIDGFDFTPSTSSGSSTTDDENDEGSSSSSSSSSSRISHGDRMFLKLSYHRPHSPYDPPGRLFEKHLRHEAPVDRFVNNTSWDKRYLNTTGMAKEAWHGDPGVDLARRTRAAYLANVEFVDEGVGLVLDRLRQKGVGGPSSRDLFVVLTADHGDMNGDHNLWRKGYPYEGSAHVPMVMRLPGQTVGRTSDAIVEMRDVAPTMYDLVGVLDEVRERDPLMDGSSLLPILRGEEERSVRAWLGLEHARVYDDRIHWSAIVGRHHDDNDVLWKYIFFAPNGEEQLFRLTDDPNETHDLSTVEEYGWALDMWRETMVKQFQHEGRGEDWVKDGRLVVGRASFLYGPNFPCYSSDIVPSGLVAKILALVK